MGTLLGICTHKIHGELEYLSRFEHLCLLNRLMQDVVMTQIFIWLDVGVVNHIADCKWVSLVQCVLNKSGSTIVPNKISELVPMRSVIGWRVFMDFRKLNTWT